MKFIYFQVNQRVKKFVYGIAAVFLIFDNEEKKIANLKIDRMIK